MMETMAHYPAPFDEALTRRWIDWNLENYEQYGFGLWAVVLKESGRNCVFRGRSVLQNSDPSFPFFFTSIRCALHFYIISRCFILNTFLYTPAGRVAVIFYSSFFYCHLSV